LKRNLIRDDANFSQNITYLQTKTITKTASISEDSANLKLITSVPKLFRIPFYLIKIPKDQKITAEIDKTHKKLKISSQDELPYFPYFKVLGKKGGNEVDKKV